MYKTKQVSKKVILSDENKQKILSKPVKLLNENQLRRVTDLINEPLYNYDYEGYYYPITTALKNIHTKSTPAGRAKAANIIKKKLNSISLNNGVSACLTSTQTSLLSKVAFGVQSSSCSESAGAGGLAGGETSNCLLLGHGNTALNQYIILPENIDVTFYTQKGFALTGNTTNKVMRNLSHPPNTSVRRSYPVHRKNGGSMALNMGIKFLSFFQPMLENPSIQ